VLAAIEDGRTAIWDVASGRLVGTLERHQGEVEAVTVTPDGAFIITAGSDQKVKVWDAISLREIASFGSHLAAAVDVQVSKDGTRVLSRDEQGGVFVWRLERDARSADALAALVRCLIPLTLRDGQLTPATPDTHRCR
jgi:WD40 repeat protein